MWQIPLRRSTAFPKIQSFFVIFAEKGPTLCLPEIWDYVARLLLDANPLNLGLNLCGELHFTSYPPLEVRERGGGDRIAM